MYNPFFAVIKTYQKFFLLDKFEKFTYINKLVLHFDDIQLS